MLRSHGRGESDRVFALYTRDFGFVWARASAVRREDSRMRYALQRGAIAQVSLVRGTRGWRVAGAAATSQLPLSARAAHAVYARMSALLERLVHGEEVNEYLFRTLADAHHALKNAREDTHAVIELVAVARMLYALGYLSTEALQSALFTHTAYDAIHLEEALKEKRSILTSVNKALTETQL